MLIVSAPAGSEGPANSSRDAVQISEQEGGFLRSESRAGACASPFDHSCWLRPDEDIS